MNDDFTLELQSETNYPECTLYFKKYILPSCLKTLFSSLVSVLLLISIFRSHSENIHTLILIEIFIITLLYLRLKNIIKTLFLPVKWKRKFENKIDTLIFTNTGFSIDSKKITLKYEYNELEKIEKLNNFVVLYLKRNFLSKNKKSLPLPIYSSAFNNINIDDFIRLIQKQISDNNNRNLITKTNNGHKIWGIKRLMMLIFSIALCFIFILVTYSSKIIANSAYTLSGFYREGIFVSPNIQQEIMWLEKAVQKGNIDATTDLGVDYSQGHGVKQDKTKAKELYLRAANAGDYLAMYNLGDMYSGVGEINAKRSQAELQQAIFWYNKSLQTRQNYCAAYQLGILYATGKGTTQDAIIAKDCFNQSGALLLDELLKNKKDITGAHFSKSDLSKAYAEYEYSKLNNINSKIFADVSPLVEKLSIHISKNCQ